MSTICATTKIPVTPFSFRAAVQVNELHQVVVGEANSRRLAASSSVPEDLLVQPLGLAPSHGAGLDQVGELAAQLATLRAELEAEKLENKKLRGEVTEGPLVHVTCDQTLLASVATLRGATTL